MKAMKRVLALGLAFAMAVTAVPATTAEAATAPKLSQKSVTVAHGSKKDQTKSITVTVPSTWKSAKVATSIDKKTVATVKNSSVKSNKATVKVTAVKKGTAKVTVKVTGKKSGKAVSKTLSLSVKTVNNGAKILDGDISLTVGATQKLKVKKIPTAATIASFVSDKEEVAKVAADGTVEAVAVGEANIYFTTDYGAKSAAIKVTVTEKEAEVPQLTAVKQTASNGFEATFSADASKIDKADLKVVANDDSKLELLVNEIKASEDGKTLSVTLYSDFTNGTSYTITYKESSQVLEAKVGSVAKINILTASAQQGVSEPIKFELIDTNGYDITHAISVDTTVLVEVVEGSYSSAELNKASAAKITMTTVGDKVTVRITYSTNQTGVEPVVAEATIECVDPKAVVGKGLYVSSTNTNTTSKCAKFYIPGTSATELKVAVDGSDSNVFFCATDDNGDAIFYDKYEVASSSDDIVTVDVTKDNGRYAQMTITGNKKGNATLTVKATVNGKTTPYYMYVTVTQTAQPKTLTLTQTNAKMSNAVDSDYKGTVKAVVTDTEGNKMTPDSVSFKVLDWDKKGGKNNLFNPAAANSAGANGFGLNDWNNPQETTTNNTPGNETTEDYYASAAKAGTYTIEVTAAKDDWTQTKRVNVTVEALPEAAYKQDGVAVTYLVEQSKTTLDAKNNESNVVKVYATVNGKFAGYVRSSSAACFASTSPAAITSCVIGMGMVGKGDYTGLQVIPSAKTELIDIFASVKYGNTVFGGSMINLYNANSNSGSAASFTDSITANVRATNPSIYADYTDQDYAKTGTYSVIMKFDYKDSTVQDATKTNTFTVKNTIYVPTVKLSSKTLDSLDDDGIKKVLSISVDMNNDESLHESFRGYATTGGATPTESNGKLTIKYIKVTEDSITFYVPCSATFRTE